MDPKLISDLSGATLCRAALYRPHIEACLALAEINTPVRLAAFFAQVGHESVSLGYMAEIWGPTDAQKRYERDPNEPWPASREEASLDKFKRNRLAFTLGNTEPGDGKRFKGRGPIQITGHFNYVKFGKLMGLDLENDPSLLDDPHNAWMSAAHYWKSTSCNTYVDSRNFKGLTKRINGGDNGLDDRTHRWVHNKAVLGI